MALVPPSHSIDAVIFDVGGVLLLPDPNAGREAFALFGCAPTDEEWWRAHYATNLVLDAMVGASDWVAARRAFAASLGVREEFFGDAVPLLEKLMVSTPYVPVGGAPDTLRLLAQADYKLGVVSNAFGTVAEDLEAQGICSVAGDRIPRVGVIVDSHLVGLEKPDPKIFHLALEALEVEASRAIYVGDTVKFDVNGATEAGLYPIHMDPYGFCGEDHSHIAALSELIDWLVPRTASVHGTTIGYQKFSDVVGIISPERRKRLDKIKDEMSADSERATRNDTDTEGLL